MENLYLYALVFYSNDRTYPVQFSFDKGELEEICDALNELHTYPGSYDVEEVKRGE